MGVIISECTVLFQIDVFINMMYAGINAVENDTHALEKNEGSVGKYLDVYERIIDVFKGAKKLAAQESMKSEDTMNNLRSIEYTYRKDDSIYGANMFSIVQPKTKEAYAYTSTIGTSFGSLINSNLHPIILNNLVSYAALDFSIYGTINSALLQPLIAFKNDQVRTKSKEKGFNFRILF
uniref:DUF5683 domain-containing protein n=1 Tax=Heterorhabditis bacteriophora TaxID=37862 RepID=A0A1I7WGF5_HETBA